MLWMIPWSMSILVKESKLLQLMKNFTSNSNCLQNLSKHPIITEPTPASFLAIYSFIAPNPDPDLSLCLCLHGYISGDVLMLISCAEYSPHRTDDGHGIKIFDFYSSPDAGTDSIPFLSATSAGCCCCFCLCFAPDGRMVPQSNIAYQAVVPPVITYLLLPNKHKDNRNARDKGCTVGFNGRNSIFISN